MLAKACSAAVNGIEAYPVKVEVNTGFGDNLMVMNRRIALPPNRFPQEKALQLPTQTADMTCGEACQ